MAGPFRSVYRRVAAHPGQRLKAHVAKVHCCPTRGGVYRKGPTRPCGRNHKETYCKMAHATAKMDMTKTRIPGPTVTAGSAGPDGNGHGLGARGRGGRRV